MKMYMIKKRSLGTSLLCAAGLIVFIGCGGAEKLSSPAAPIADTLTDKGEHLLVEPMAEGEKLLGRPVTLLAEGGVEIADSRAPGCEVIPSPVGSKWKRTFHQEAEYLAGFSAELAKVASLKAEYKEGIRLETVVRNEQTISANLSGTCGDLVITSVKIGTGHRELQYKKSAKAGGSVGWNSISAGGGGGAEKSMEATLTWETPQAWAFTVGTVKNTDQAEITIQMPGELTPGQQFEPRITAEARALWLVVLSCYDGDKCSVLRPSHKIPTEQVPSGRTITLWPMIAESAADGGQSVEKMVVYGFPEKGDFKMFSPPKGVLSIDTSSKYAADLERRLVNQQEIPARRWTRAEFNYVVKAVDTVEQKNDVSDDQLGGEQ